MNEIAEVQYEPDDSELGGKIDKVRKLLKKCKTERQEYLDGWQRALADFQNYKKQQESEVRDFKKFVVGDVILKILPVLDNLDLACESIPEESRGAPWTKGVLNVKRQFAALLSEYGLSEISVSGGDKLDPLIHESIGETEVIGESGTIAEVLQKGYMLHGKVIRAARVKVIK